MNIESEVLEDHQVKLVVEVEEDVFEGTRRRAAKKLSRNVKIPGFRPGKAPFPVVVRHVGEGAILEEALDILLDELYPQLIEESGIDPYGPGSLDNIQSTDPPVLEFIVPLAPEVTLGNYRDIRIPYELDEVTDEDVQNVLDQIQDGQAILETVERPAEMGDVVYISISGEKFESEDEAGEDPGEVEGETDPTLLVPERHINVLVEEKEAEENDSEWPFPGFSLQLIGVSAEDTLSVEHQFPEDEELGNLSATNVKFHISVQEVVSRELPEINDELAQTAGEYETLEELRAYIRTSLEENNLSTYNQQYDDQILTEIVDQSEIKYPPQMLQQEINVVKRQLEDQLATQRLDLDTYLKTQGMDEEALEEDMKPVATQRIERGLVLLEIGTQEGIELDREEVAAEVDQTLTEIYGRTDQQPGQQISGAARENLIDQFMNDRYVHKTEERLRQIAKGEDLASEEEQGQEIETDEQESPKSDETTEVVEETEVTAQDQGEGVIETAEEEAFEESEAAVAEGAESKES